MTRTRKLMFGCRSANRLTVRVMIVVGLALAMRVSPVVAQESAVDFVQPRVTRAQFTEFTQALGIERDQRSIFEMLFASYTQELTSLTELLDAEATRAGRQATEDALAGRTRMDADELRRTRAAVLRVYEAAFEPADAALADLLMGVETVLTADQESRFAPAARDLRRQVLLHPRQAHSRVQDYAGDGVDVLQLVEDAQQPGGELAGVDVTAMQPLLQAYEQQLDVLLQTVAVEDARGQLLRRIASMQRDDARLRELEREALDRWKQLHELNDSTVQQIANIVASTSNEDAKRLWLERFDRACFPWVYPRRRPDRQIEWMRNRQLPGETMEQAEAEYATYLQKRGELARRAIDLMMRGRLELHMMIYGMMDATTLTDRSATVIHQELLRNSGELTSLENATAGALEALLPADLRDSMRNALRGPDTVLQRR